LRYNDDQTVAKQKSKAGNFKKIIRLQATGRINLKGRERWHSNLISKTLKKELQL
jgi:hypothetical protein